MATVIVPLIAFNAGIAILFVSNWIAWILPPGFLLDAFNDFGQFISTVISLGIGYCIGAFVDQYSTRYRRGLLLLCIEATTLCVFSWYFFNYMHYRPVAIDALSKSSANPEATLEQFFKQQTGQSGFLGYLMWSTYAGAEVKLNDNVDPLQIPAGGIATVVNVGKFFLAIVLSILWARSGLYSALMERARQGKPTGDELGKIIDHLADD